MKKPSETKPPLEVVGWLSGAGHQIAIHSGERQAAEARKQKANEAKENNKGSSTVRAHASS